MKPKVIKTEADNEEALARIEKLMDAKAGTSRGDELELLALLVHKYEETRFPMDKPDSHRFSAAEARCPKCSPGADRSV